ncbi:Ig-like domain-containing protein [Methanolobus sp. ZRKC3]|uniref:invasin domain 3-containing protein n=1 Tax=Methanolobus sp. ZRKC3 TaxID=3125786 RepID=UPI00324589D8
MKTHNSLRIVATLFILILVSGLFLNGASAKTVETDIYVNQNEPYIFEFTVDGMGIIDAELISFEGMAVELALVLESPAGNREEVWWSQDTGMPLSLIYEVSGDDIRAGEVWKILVVSGISAEGAGVLKITYPAEEAPIEEGPIEEIPVEEEPLRDVRELPEKEVPKEYEEESGGTYYVLPLGIIFLILIVTFVAGGALWKKMRSASPNKLSQEEKEKAENQTGSIEAISKPEKALVYLDETPLPIGLSPHSIAEVSVGPHELKFIKIEKLKCWYGKKEAIVVPGETVVVECELKENEIKMVLSAEPGSIPADGTSSSNIKVQIEDKDGVPILVPEDIRIDLQTDLGMIQTPVIISVGYDSTMAVLESSESGGTATIKAECKGIFKESIEVKFTELGDDN